MQEIVSSIGGEMKIVEQQNSRLHDFGMPIRKGIIHIRHMNS